MAASLEAAIACRTGIPVIAIDLVGRKHASALLVARIIGTEIPVVAFNDIPSEAPTAQARISLRTAATIVARQGIRNECASIDGVASIVCARVSVRAVHRTSGLTRTLAAGIPHRAPIVVGAGLLVSRMDASSGWVTRIVGAQILIVAGHR